uniref:uncharacterized protein LOC122582084 n=1 Tax=Erigeron canadensis TaxID=72917 RepID=UPI001CB90906|nr:uncharacterized protein LOC122582084 [Erigeron canadensis]
MESLSSKKRTRSDSDESGFNSVETKRMLLDILDDSDINSVSQDLDSFIKTFQDEISPATENESTELTQSRPELGFLLEASDDELGLPPTDEKTNNGLAESVEQLSDLWGFDNENIMTSYDSFEYEFGYGDFNDDINNNSNNGGGEYVALDGLFDHTDLGFGSSDLLWRPETLPAQ